MPKFKPAESDEPSLPSNVRPYLSDKERAARRKPRPIGDVVDRIMTSVAGGRAAPAVVLGSRWAEVVGADFASRTAPGKCQSGRLTILVKDGSTASKLRFQTAQILQNAARIAGEGVVTAVSFKVSPSMGQKPTT